MAENLFPEKYPDGPGVKSGDDTAIAAQQVAALHNSERKKMCFDAIKEKPGAMHEIAARLNKPLRTVAPILSQLRKLRLIEDSKQRFPTPMGGKAIVWQVVQPQASQEAA